MSLNTNQTIKCPACGQMHEITVWNSITVSDSPDLKDDLLKGKINIFNCPSCSHRALMPVPLLYHDEAKKLMISFSPCEDDVTKRQLFSNIKESSMQSGELSKLEGYTLRFVSEYNNLLEKILLLDFGLWDKAIELIKLMILTQEPEKSEHRKCMFGKMENDEIEFLVQDKKENQIYTSRVPKSSYDAISEQLRMSGAKPYSFDWELVDIDYAAALLDGINNSFRV